MNHTYCCMSAEKKKEVYIQILKKRIKDQDEIIESHRYWLEDDKSWHYMEARFKNAKDKDYVFKTMKKMFKDMDKKEEKMEKEILFRAILQDKLEDLEKEEPER